MFNIIIILIFLIIFLGVRQIKKENFVNITNPFSNGQYAPDGLSQFQLGTEIPDDSQILTKPVVPLSQYSIKNKKIYKYFINNKYNNDYRDVQTAFINISPNQKKLFNLQELPVRTTYYKNDPPLEAFKLIVQFVGTLNNEIKKLPESTEIINNYNNQLPMTSDQQDYIRNKGINKFYNDIGVDYNLYAETPINAPVELIDFVNVEKQFTINETKYIISFVIKKILKSVKEQMKITVHFVMKNSVLENENLFNKVEDTTYNKSVAVEYIFVDGYFSNNFDTPYDGVNKQAYDDGQFYDFDELGKNNLMSDHEILTELNKKYREHALDMNNFAVNVPYPVYQNPKYAQQPQFS